MNFSIIMPLKHIEPFAVLPGSRYLSFILYDFLTYFLMKVEFRKFSKTCSWNQNFINGYINFYESWIILQQNNIYCHHFFYYFWKKVLYNIYVNFFETVGSISTKFYKYKAKELSFHNKQDPNYLVIFCKHLFFIKNIFLGST